jgi:hypothetical protein
MTQPQKDDRNNPKNQGETCSTGHQTGFSQATDKDRMQGQKKDQDVAQGQHQKSGEQKETTKSGTPEHQPQKKEHSTTG